MASQLVNNFIFVRIGKDKTTTYRKQSLGSSLLARFADIALFETLAFFGILSIKEFLTQAVFAYVAGMLLEAVLSIPAGCLVKFLRQKLKFYDGKVE